MKCCIFWIEDQHNTIFAIVLYRLQWNFKACFDIHSIPETFQAKSNFQIKQTNITKTPSTTCSSFSAPLKNFCFFWKTTVKLLRENTKYFE